MLDVQSGGRLIAGFMRGIPHEYVAYNFAPDDSYPRMREACELILKCWTEPLPFGLMAMLRTSPALDHDFCLLQDIKYFAIERLATHVHIEALQDG